MGFIMGCAMSANGPAPRSRARPLARLGLAAALLAGAGCVTVSPDAVQLLTSAQQKYSGSNWVSAEQEAARFIQKYNSSPVVAEAYYIRGMARFQQQQYASSEADFQQALAESKRPDLTAKVRTMLGHLAMRREDPAAAVEHYRASVKDLPEKPPKDEIYYRFAVALQRVGQWDEARFYLARVTDGYPRGEWYELARRRLAWPGRFFSIQSGFYRELKFAAQQHERLRAAGLDARQSMNIIGGEPRYIVYVGRYPTYRDARTDLGRVKVLVPDAVIVP